MALPSITDSLTHAALKLQALVPMDAKNPFDGVEPDFSIFGVKFNKGLAIGLGLGTGQQHPCVCFDEVAPHAAAVGIE